MKVQAIFGPPGTGKTRECIKIADRESAHGKVLYLSFTRTAAAEAVSRLPDSSSVEASTIHSLAFNKLGLSRASVIDSKKLTEFGTAAGFQFREKDEEPQEGDEYLSVLHYANNKIIDPAEAYDQFSRPGTLHRFHMFIKSYSLWKNTYGYVDFDDMLGVLIKSDISFDGVSSVILDEAQDCSPLQWRAMTKICENTKSVHIAGDDDQAIYEWSGADPHGMTEFLGWYDGGLRVLNQSHRIPYRVHEFVHNKVLSKIERRVDKKFNHRHSQGSIIRYGDLWDVDLHEFNKSGGMILVRDRWRAEEVKKELNRCMIPYQMIGGSSPWTSKIAQELKRGESPEIPIHWREFYNQADLSQPINITLSTIHQAKGRESHQVLVDLQLSNRAMLDLYRNRDAELRVMYVALTRTSDKLLLCNGNPLL